MNAGYEHTEESIALESRAAYQLHHKLLENGQVTSSSLSECAAQSFEAMSSPNNSQHLQLKDLDSQTILLL
jgi:hypothetical protein